MVKKNIYYIGYRVSDIAASFDMSTTDSFFKGSITCYGDNKNGNIAYNAITGMQFSLYDHQYCERNNAVYTKFISEQCKKVAEQNKHALFLPYGLYFAEKIPDELQTRIICFNNVEVLSFLNSKFKFKKLIDGKIPQARFEFMTGAAVFELIRSGEAPNNREIVVQEEYGSSGEGTLIITKKNFADPAFVKNCMDLIKEDETYVVSEFIENSHSVSIHFQVSNNEVAVYPPGIQLMNGPSFAGCDLFAFSQFDDEIKNECIAVAQKFGEILRDMGSPDGLFPGVRIRGYFGLDVIIAKKGTPRVYAVETNARFTGSAGLLNILSNLAGAGSIYEHTFQAFYDDKTDFAAKFKKISPNGRKRYAEIERGEDGRIITDTDCNQEGLDQTVYQEYDFYTHAIFEEVKNYNVYDDRKKYKKYVSGKSGKA